jgi:hypothetical protein
MFEDIESFSIGVKDATKEEILEAGYNYLVSKEDNLVIIVFKYKNNNSIN